MDLAEELVFGLIRRGLAKFMTVYFVILGFLTTEGRERNHYSEKLKVRNGEIFCQIL